MRRAGASAVADAARGGNKGQNTVGLAASNEHAAPPRRAFRASLAVRLHAVRATPPNRLMSLCWPPPVA